MWKPVVLGLAFEPGNEELYVRRPLLEDYLELLKCFPQCTFKGEQVFVYHFPRIRGQSSIEANQCEVDGCATKSDWSCVVASCWAEAHEGTVLGSFWGRFS